MSAVPKVSAVLWDLDGTLLRSRGLARISWQLAFECTTGLHMPALADQPGATARHLIDQYLLAAGVRPDRHLRSEFFAQLAQIYDSLQRQENEDCVALPGAVTVLTALASLPLLQTVVTGNTQRVAAAKLTAAGLRRQLTLAGGAFGDESPSRGALVELAMRRVIALTGLHREPPTFAVVGDTVQDVEAAHAAGAMSIAVVPDQAARRRMRLASPTHIVGSVSEVLPVVTSEPAAAR